MQVPFGRVDFSPKGALGLRFCRQGQNPNEKKEKRGREKEFFRIRIGLDHRDTFSFKGRGSVLKNL